MSVPKALVRKSDRWIFECSWCDNMIRVDTVNARLILLRERTRLCKECLRKDNPLDFQAWTDGLVWNRIPENLWKYAITEAPDFSSEIRVAWGDAKKAD